MIDPAKPDFRNTPVSEQRAKYGYAPAHPEAEPLVTVVTPFYNVGEVFFETAESLFRQSLQQWEWLILDDASTSSEALATIEKISAWTDPRIRLIQLKQNQGPAAVRNLGFESARAPLIFTLDADDLIEPTALEKCLWYLTSHPESAFVSGYSVGFDAKEYLWCRGYHENAAFLKENLAPGFTLIRRAAFAAAGGYDVTLKTGFEDWDFWLRLANAGQWGSTIPEYLAWYRRRQDHRDRWTTWDRGRLQQDFIEQLPARYPRLAGEEWPQPRTAWHTSFETPEQTLPGENRLLKNKRRLLMIVPWYTMGGSDKFTLDLVREMTLRGWEVTLAATLRGDNNWAPEFAKLTPDLFILHHFLKLSDFPRFMKYLIRSRQSDAVLITNSEIGYQLLPYLRAMCPEPAYLDYCHMEETYWKNGGYPRYAAAAQPMLDLNIVSSNHLKSWMAGRGASPERIEVCHTNIDPGKWKPDAEQRRQKRGMLDLPLKQCVLLYAVRITGQKQPRVFAHAMLELHRRGLDFTALVAGDGPDRPWLEDFIAKEGMKEKVRLLGALPNEEIRNLMTACDILFLPSLWEGIALALFEAMAMELVVVGGIVGGQIELVTPDCGILLPRSDEATEGIQYGAALAELVADPARRRDMGRRARARIIQHFPMEQMGNRMDALVQRAIDHHRSHPRPFINEAVGVELASRAIEFIRLDELCNYLWARQSEASRLAAASATPEVEGQFQEWAERDLAIVENSPAWRFFLAVHRNSLWRLLARAGLIVVWDPGRADTPPTERLQRIVGTRYFQTVLYLRQTRLYKLGQSLRGRNKT